MNQCHSVKQTKLNINISILYPGLFLLYAYSSVCSQMSMEKSKDIYLSCIPFCMGPGIKKKKTLG